MFTNIGKKIKTLAQVICWLGIIGSVISGFGLMATEDDLIGIGVLVMVLGALFSWIGSFFLYGFGELIDQTQMINTKLGPQTNFYGGGNTQQTWYQYPDYQQPNNNQNINF